MSASGTVSASKVGSSLRYRPEIDGLRAIALLPVLLFHAGFERFAGGFVGVDVFFVISGYLITSIILGEMGKGTFSIARFYERRARRILPPLLVVSLVCVPFAWKWMLPSELTDFSQSLVAVNLFSSNILFWRETDYFAAAAELKPLLHTWSLAVEEQFYLFFPLSLVALRRHSRKFLLPTLAALTLVSLGLAHWASQAHPEANFFLLPTRAWELGVGAILAIAGAENRFPAGGKVAQVGSAIGLIAIAFSVFAFDEAVPFPSAWGLVPVLGTALLVVYATPSTLVGRMLSWRLMVGIGLVSYSAYLWHQPLFAFARIRILSGVTPFHYFGLCLLSLGLAFLSWRWVERPFRDKATISRRQVVLSLTVASISLVTVGFAGSVMDGFPDRNHKVAWVTQNADRIRPNRGLNELCQGSFTVVEECRTDDSPEVLVWGNSIAMHLVDGILASDPDASIVQMTITNCGPIFGIAPISSNFPESRARHCIAFNEQVRNWILVNESVRYAVLATPITGYIREGASVVLGDDVVREPGTETVLEQFRATLDWLIDRDITPVVFSSLPADGRDIGLCLVRTRWLGLSEATECDIEWSRYRETGASTLRFFESIDRDYHVVWLSDGLCDAESCRTSIGDTLIYRDEGHMTPAGSRYLGQTMDFYRLIRDSPAHP